MEFLRSHLPLDVCIARTATSIPIMSFRTPMLLVSSCRGDTSLGYHQRFADALPEAIVGRTVDVLNVDRLAGPSGRSKPSQDQRPGSRLTLGVLEVPISEGEAHP